MLAFDHVLVFLSVAYGLALTGLVERVGELVYRRGRVRFDWIPLVFAGLIGLVIVEHWWTLYEGQHTDITFAGFLVALLDPLLIYFAVVLLIPEMKARRKSICGPITSAPIVEFLPWVR